jgi:hypothetical protein
MTTDSDRLRMDRAREAAESLFKPRAAPAEPRPDAAADRPGAEAAPPRRQPKVLMIPSQAPSQLEPNASGSRAAKPAPRTGSRRLAARQEVRTIPSSQFGRIRALARYGMTREQVAELYAVPVSLIDRIVGPDEADTEVERG